MSRGGQRAGSGDPEVRPGLRPVVDTEHGDDDPVEFGRHAQLTRAVPVLHRHPGHQIRAGRAGQRRAEGGGDSSRRAGDLHPAGRLINPVDGQPGTEQNAAHQLDVGPVRAVASAQHRLFNSVQSLDQLGRHRSPAAQHHRHLDHLSRIDRTTGNSRRHRRAGTARNRKTRRGGHHASLAPFGGQRQDRQHSNRRGERPGSHRGWRRLAAAGAAPRARR